MASKRASKDKKTDKNTSEKVGDQAVKSAAQPANKKVAKVANNTATSAAEPVDKNVEPDVSATVKTTAAKKHTTKKVPVNQTSVKKTSVKKTSIKKTPAKKAPAKKAPAKKTTTPKKPTKQSVAQKSTAKQSSADKSAVKRNSASEQVADVAQASTSAPKTKNKHSVQNKNRNTNSKNKAHDVGGNTITRQTNKRSGCCRVFKWLLLGVLVLLVILVARTLSTHSLQVEPSEPVTLNLDAEREIATFAQGLQFLTVSVPVSEAETFDLQPFLDLQDWLAERYPNAHAAMQKQVVNQASLIYRWPAAGSIAENVEDIATNNVVAAVGDASDESDANDSDSLNAPNRSDDNDEDGADQPERNQYQFSGKLIGLPDANQALPILFMAHTDVVPVAATEIADWTHDPYSGHVDQRHIWGRGALDFKLGVFAQLAAVDALVQAGYAPQRDIYFAFGHDEESNSDQGAYLIAKQFAEQGLYFEVAVDEGGSIVDGLVDGVDYPIALVGTAEKASLTLELVVEQLGGHSSMPPQETAIGILSQAITALEQNPMPATISEPMQHMFDALAPEADWPTKLVLQNRWLFAGLLKQQMLQQPSSAAALRNTTAVTMLEAGIKPNVLAEQAVATVNFRLLPGVRPIEVVQHVQRTIDDDRVYVVQLPTLAPGEQRISEHKTASFDALQRSIRTTWPDVVVAPYLSTATMDARHFEGVAEQVYRFAPMYFQPEDVRRLHGVDERIATRDYLLAIQFYANAFNQLAGLTVVQSAEAFGSDAAEGSADNVDGGNAEADLNNPGVGEESVVDSSDNTEAVY